MAVVRPIHMNYNYGHTRLKGREANDVWKAENIMVVLPKKVGRLKLLMFV